MFFLTYIRKTLLLNIRLLKSSPIVGVTRTLADIHRGDLKGFVAVTPRCDVIGGISYCIYKSRIADIPALAVHPDFKGNGVGSKLVLLVLDSLKQEGVKEVNIVPVENSEGFCSRHGFVQTKNSYPFMRKSID